eukprot:CAMPEP_0185278706 /NCGR_PEP_ID=MMETSP1359-20130426/61698_1 /TAXON_ID=552665 /ORGANISM="Bigelowiella longifila, Strain CCMP242" /LENGTH=33 /DNA_ID= /DNA_START= /DNA_END= /DNA_ORIENTATION=
MKSQELKSLSQEEGLQNDDSGEARESIEEDESY